MSDVVINTNGYTIERVKDLKDQIPVNENNIMDLTSAYIDEDELREALQSYASKTLMYSEINPMNVEIDNIKDELNTKPSFAWVLENLPTIESPNKFTSITFLDPAVNDTSTAQLSLEDFGGDVRLYIDKCIRCGLGIKCLTLVSDNNIQTPRVNATTSVETPAINGYKMFTQADAPFEAPSIARIKSDSVMEVGKYIDMHNTLDYARDYTIRLTCNDNSLGVSGGLEAKGDVSCDNVLVKSSIYASSGDISSKTMYASTQINSPIVMSSELSDNGSWTQTLVRPCEIEFKNADGAHWSMKCYTGDSGTGRIAFKDFHNGAEIRIDPTNLMYSKLNSTITHNAPINEPIEAFQLGTPVFSTGIIHHYDPNTRLYVAGTDGFTNCIPSVKTIGSYKQYLGICIEIHPNGHSISIGDVVTTDITIEQPTITFATHGDFLFRVNNSSQYEVGDVVLFDGNKLDENLMITTKIQQSIVGKVTGIVNEHLLAIFKD